MKQTNNHQQLRQQRYSNSINRIVLSILILLLFFTVFHSSGLSTCLTKPQQEQKQQNNQRHLRIISQGSRIEHAAVAMNSQQFSSSTMYDESSLKQQMQAMLRDDINKQQQGTDIATITKQQQQEQQQNIDSIKTKINNNNYNNDNYDTSNKRTTSRTAIVHIGPMKTGTTSIQIMLRQMEDELRKDNYEVASLYYKKGENSPSSFVSCFQQQEQSLTKSKIRAKKALRPCDQNLLHKIQQQNNFIISAEGLHHPSIDLQLLNNYLLSSWDNIHIVAFYRRYYDWYYSYYNQSQKNKAVKDRTTIIQYVMNQYRLSTQGGKDPFDSFYTPGVVKRYMQYFGTNSNTNNNNKKTTQIHVYNVHDLPNHGSIQSTFLCEVIPNATNACNHYQNESKRDDLNGNSTSSLLRSRQKNSHKSLVYEELAYYAHDMNLWSYPSSSSSSSSSSIISDTASSSFSSNTSNIEQKRILQQVAEKAKVYHKINLQLNEFDGFDSKYITCLEPMVYDWLYKISLQAEEMLFPKYYEQYGKKEIQIEFEKSKIKYCHINAQAIIQNDTMWRTFFSNLSLSEMT